MFKVGDTVIRTFTSYHSAQFGIGRGDIGVVVGVSFKGSQIKVRYFKGPVINNSVAKLQLVENEQSTNTTDGHCSKSE